MTHSALAADRERGIAWRPARGRAPRAGAGVVDPAVERQRCAKAAAGARRIPAPAGHARGQAAAAVVGDRCGPVPPARAARACPLTNSTSPRRFMLPRRGVPPFLALQLAPMGPWFGTDRSLRLQSVRPSSLALRGLLLALADDCAPR
jgi:hypothetical protein